MVQDKPVVRPRPETERAIARRQRIIDAAVLLFREKGFQASSTADIAQRSELSVAQLYRDFKSKDDLILVITRQVAERYCAADAADQAIAQKDGPVARDWLFGLLIRSIEGADYDLVPELVSAAIRDPKIAEVMIELDNTISTRLQAVLEILAPAVSEQAIAEACFTITTFIIGASTRFQAQGGQDPSILHQARAFIEDQLSRLTLL